MTTPELGKKSYRGSGVFADGIEIMFKFAFEKDVWGIREIAAELSMDKSKAHRLLQTMEDKGLVQKTENRKYKMDQRFWQLAIGVYGKIDYLGLSLPIMERLATETKETIIFWTLNNGRITFVHRISSNHPIQYLAELGTSYPVSLGSTSKIVMSYMPQDELDALIKKQFSHYNQEQLDKLHQQIEGAKNNGYSIAIGERISETVGISSVIKNEQGKVVAGINIAMPSSRYTVEVGEHYGKILCNEVKKISLS
jgi:DNA-binding IclR family transcriptional regulator